MKHSNAMQIKSIILTIFTVCVLTCLSCTTKAITGDYYIERFEEGVPVYYIRKKDTKSPGGIFDGIVTKVGRKSEYLFAKVQRLSSADASGWYKLNVRSGKVSGPLDYQTDCRNINEMDVALFYQNPTFNMGSE